MFYNGIVQISPRIFFIWLIRPTWPFRHLSLTLFSPGSMYHIMVRSSVLCSRLLLLPSISYHILFVEDRGRRRRSPQNCLDPYCYIRFEVILCRLQAKLLSQGNCQLLHFPLGQVILALVIGQMLFNKSLDGKDGEISGLQYFVGNTR